MNWATQTSTKTSQRFVEAAVIGRDLLRGLSCVTRRNEIAERGYSPR
jgi:hypothetical protein